MHNLSIKIRIIYSEVYAAFQGEAGKPGVPGRDGVPGKEGIAGLPGKQVCVCFALCLNMHQCLCCVVCGVHCAIFIMSSSVPSLCNLISRELLDPQARLA